MALSTATISYDVSDQVGTDFDTRRTKVWVSTNITDGTVIDTVGNAIRVDTGQGTLAADGTGSVTVWTPGTGSNPDSWQTYVHLDYASPMDRTRKRRTFGPFTVTTSANLADLVEEQEVPAEYLTTITAALQDLVDDAEAEADSAAAASVSAAASATSAAASAATAEVISDIATPDGVVEALILDDGSDTYAALAAFGIVFNVKNYGATGNGSTDDTTAIQSAANAACTAAGTLFFPPGTYMVNPGVTNASGTSYNLINLTGPVHVQISPKATVKVISSTTPFGTVFGATTSLINMTGSVFDGGGTIDCNSAARIAAHVVPNTTTPNVGIARLNIGTNIGVRHLRFTNFDSIWCVAMSSSNLGNMSNNEVAYCQFDNLGTPTAADKHDFSAIYLDAIGMSVHHNKFWAGTPGAQTFTTNYGARTAIELHGSGQKCHDNETYGLQWGGNLWISYNSWISTDLTGSKNSVGISWHDNTFLHCAVGINLGGANNAGTNYGLSEVKVHNNTISVDPSIWNVNTGGGVFASGIMLPSGLVTGSFTGIDISHNDIFITPNNTAMNAFTFISGPDAPAAHISICLVSANVTTLRDWTISNNTLRGSCRDGINVQVYSVEGMTISNNRIVDPHLATGSTGVGVYIITTGAVAATNKLNNVMIANNLVYDDQYSGHAPYGYAASTMGGVVYWAGGSASNSFILDNGYHCKNGATQPIVAGNAGTPAPLVRATDQATTFAAPSGTWAMSSTITTTAQYNTTAPTGAVWVQTGNSNGAGSVWQRRPTFSGVVAKTTTYTAICGDIVLANPTGAGFTVTLPAVQASAEVSVKNVAAANDVTVATTASKLIDGASTATLTPGQKARYVSDGTNWFAVSS